jgi:hypothetical protein
MNWPTDFNIIKSLLEKHFIIKSWNLADIRSDGIVDVMDDISTMGSLDRLPVRFGEVKGDFWCFSAGLTSLEGAPEVVHGDFDCSSNQLSSLAGSPRKVHKDFICSGNQAVLNNLEGISSQIGGGVYLASSRVKSLTGSPARVQGSFVVTDNLLRDLEGAPTSVGKALWCQGNSLETLAGFPASVGRVCLLSYSEDLGLLRTLGAAEVKLIADDDDKSAYAVQTILNQYAGQGRRGTFAAKKKLIEAGFEENARW